MSPEKPLFMFSVDVEDFPVVLNGRNGQAGRVFELVGRYLRFLRDREMRATFFVLGEVAERDPDIVRQIVAEGHEVGCHGHSHVTLDKHTPESFREDLKLGLDALGRAGAPKILGYRAPFLSVVPRTAWAYDVMAELGIKYSSSVNPTYNPSFGWRGFGGEPRKRSGVWELPVSLMRPFPIGIPVAGGVYFRSLPFPLISGAIDRYRARKEPVIGYFHPYDLDWESESRQCSWLVGRPISNYFIFYNRKTLLSRLERVMAKGFRIIPYREYVETLQ